MPTNLYMDDQLLIKQVSAGNQQAFYKLYDKYSGALLGVILRMCGNKVLAEELLQDTFMKIWKNIDGYDLNKGRFYTWAYRIAKNTTLNALRKTDLLIRTEDLSVHKDKSPTQDKPDHAPLSGALKRLEPHHQEAIALVYFRGYTHKEAHQAMGVPLGTFKSYVRQALSALRKNYSHGLLLWFITEILV